MAKGAAGLLLCLLCHLVPSEGFRPNCTTDYATELVCLWSGDAATSCSRGVRLHYAREPSPHRDARPLPSVCVPEDGPTSAWPPQCSCRIPGTDFRRTWFLLALEVNGTGAGPVARVKAEERVKPRRLVNLTADTGRSHSVVLAWQWDAVYTQEQKEDLLLSSPTYQVACWPAGHRDKGVTHETNEQSYEIFVSRLSPGPHAASVRFRLPHFGDIWSEWSTPCKFPVGSASRPDSGDVLWMCAVVMAAILASYLCFARLKRSWWDHIPDPAKSKVTGDVIAKPLSAVRKTHAVGEGKAPLGGRWERDYENFPGALWPGTAALTAGEKLLRQGGPGPRLASFLTPEVPLVASPLTICSRVPASKAEGPAGEAAVAAAAEAAPPHHDAVASLFLKLLDCDFRTAGEDPGSLELPPAPDHGPEPLPEAPLGSAAARESQQGASPCGYRSFLVEADAPWGAGPALQQQQQAPSSPAPQQGDGSPTAAALLSGYRDLSSLLSQSTAGPRQGWEPEAGQRRASGPEGWGPVPALPGGVPWRPACEAAALDFQPQQQGGPKAAYQNLLQQPWAAPLASGYQSFSSALQGGTAGSAQHDGGGGGPSLASPYRPFLAVLRSGLPETQQAGGGAGLDPAAGVPSAGGQERSGRGFLGEGRAGGLVYP